MVDRTPRAEAILRLIKEFYSLTGPPAFTVGHPVFDTWSRQSSDSMEDSMSRMDSSEDEDNVEPTASTSTTELSDLSAAVSPPECQSAAQTSTASRLSLKRQRTAVSVGFRHRLVSIS